MSDSCYSLTRADGVILFRLRTGRNRMRAHLYNQMRVGQTEMCPACAPAPMTTERLVQRCPLQDGPRLSTWPDETPLTEKLHGDLEALKRTASAFDSSAHCKVL